MTSKTGNAEIQYLLRKAIDKYESDTKKTIIRDQNKAHYEGIAKHLSDISNELPNTADVLNHISYDVDEKPKKNYPNGTYDITPSQIMYGYLGKVSNPKNFLLDTCYIYLYGTGRKGFEQNAALDFKLHKILRNSIKKNEIKSQKTLVISLPIVTLILLIISLKFYIDEKEWATIKNDMSILPYQPTQAEIDSLQGIWLCYTGSPQARSTDSNRYHLIVANVVDIKYKNGYFVFTRYGAHFNHKGYIQFEAPWLVSVYSREKNDPDTIESPRHSLMRLNTYKHLVYAISASWNFDADTANRIIGIREIYVKQGKGGTLKMIMESRKNGICNGCKIIQWRRPNIKDTLFYVRNILLDNLSNTSLRKLLDEKSIILAIPKAGLIKAESKTNK